MGTPVGADLASGTWLWGDGSLKSITEIIRTASLSPNNIRARCLRSAEFKCQKVISLPLRPMFGQSAIRRRGRHIDADPRGPRRRCLATELATSRQSLQHHERCGRRGHPQVPLTEASRTTAEARLRHKRGSPTSPRNADQARRARTPQHSRLAQ